MLRRGFLERVAGGIAGSYCPAFTWSGRDTHGGITHHPPPDSVSLTTVEPYSNPLTTHKQQVPHTDWVSHYFAWRTVANEPRELLIPMREAATYEITIDGESVAAPDDHWQSIEPIGKDHWRLGWTLVTPPRSLGEHEFSLRVEFDKPIVGQTRDGSRRVWRGVDERTNTYEVIRAPAAREAVRS